MNSSQMSYEQKQQKYYSICLFIGTFIYFLWKFLIYFKSPGFESWYFRTPSLLIGISFFSYSYFSKKAMRYAKNIFFTNSLVVLFEFFYLIYLYSDSYLGLFYFMGGMVLVIPHIVAWRSRKYLVLYGTTLILASITLFVSIYLKTKIFQNQTFDYISLYSTAFIVVWFLSYIHVINEEKFRALEVKLKEKEMEIIKSSRLASLGEVSGGLAHEINNPLQILNLGIDVMREKNSNLKIIEQMESAISRIGSIVEGLKFFSGKSECSLVAIAPIKEIMEKAVNVISEKATSNNILITIDSDDSKIPCQEVQLGQVFLSLLNNACDNIIKSGKNLKKISITIKSINNSVFVSIYDSGELIPKSISENIFDPFFTTKPIGQGSGLGLSISKGIIDQHNGSIKYLENPKRFEIIFKDVSSESSVPPKTA